MSVAKAASTAVEKKHCSHCDKDGHTLLDCYTVAGILRRHKQDNKRDRTKHRGSSSQKTKARKTSIVTLGDKSDNTDSSTDEDTSSRPKPTARSARLDPTVAMVVKGKATDWLVDSGCGRVMTPHDDQLIDKTKNSTRVHLADDSTIRATHSGSVSLPFNTSTPIPALQVPDLHEPLLSVAGLCDSGLDVVFTREGCGFYKRGDITIKNDEVAKGERRGDLYILPSKVKQPQSLTCHKAEADDSLFSWHT